MKDSDAEKYYTIDINKKKYTFFCSDGEQYVEKLKEKLHRTFEDLSSQEAGHILSNYAMKIALLLADEATREEVARLKQQEEVEEKIKPLLEALDNVLEFEE